MGQGPDPAIDFGKLNAAERTALSLLAQGHTAKSIAALTDRSVGAVNERLREARRKTGVGSSRELARLFAAQENRDELIGVVPAPAAVPDPAAPAATGRSWKGATLMSVIFAGAIVAIAFVVQPAPQTVPEPALAGVEAGLYSDGPSPRQLHDKIVAEPRDPAWAPRTETALEQWFAGQPPVARVTGPVTARCGTTMCEIVARYDSEISAKRQNAAWQIVQGKAFRDAIAPMGLRSDDASFAAGGIVLFVSRLPG
jgi:DNA-binding CsgD family transcriptional regulator